MGEPRLTRHRPRGGASDDGRPEAATPAAGGHAARAGWRAPGTPGVAALLGAYLLAAFGTALTMPFISDDYQILARVRFSSWLGLWSTKDLLWRWYRPWSRELHFWTLDRLFGAHEPAFHAASFVLWLAVLTLFFALARRAAGARAAGIAVAGFAAMSAWSGSLLWAAGAQDLWMMVFVLAFLHGFARGNTAASLAALAGALLSKETAGVAPGLALAWAILVDRDSATTAARRVLPAMVLVAAWFLLHPTLLARLHDPARLGVEVATRQIPLVAVLGKTLASLVSLADRPAPSSGWAGALTPALPAIAALAALAAWSAFARDGDPQPPSRSAALGGAWAAIAWLPLALPSIDWHPYYTLLGAMGAWLVLGCVLVRAPAIATAVVVVAATLAPVQADTPIASFSASLYQRRQAYFVGHLRQELLRLHPSLPPRARLYFARVPNSIGLGYAWFSPAFTVWYGDSTIHGGFYSAYRLRAVADRGPDYFFRYDSTTVGWVQVAPEPGGATALPSDPQWRADHGELAALFARAADWRGAASEYARLFAAFPDSAEFIYGAGVSAEMAGDSALARRSYQALLASHAATADQREFARGYSERARAGR